MFKDNQNTAYTITLHPLTKEQYNKRVCDWSDTFNRSLDYIKQAFYYDFFPEEFVEDKHPSDGAIEEIVKLTTQFVTMLRSMGVTPEKLRLIEERIRTQNETRGFVGEEEEFDGKVPHNINNGIDDWY